MAMAEEMLRGSNEEPIKTYFYHEHSSKLLHNLNQTRHLKHLCDGIVTFGESAIDLPVQKNVLSAASPYFRYVECWTHLKIIPIMVDLSNCSDHIQNGSVIF